MYAFYLLTSLARPPVPTNFQMDVFYDPLDLTTSTLQCFLHPPIRQELSRNEPLHLDAIFLFCRRLQVIG